MGKQVMGIKEGTCDEHWLLYGSVESLNSIRETDTTLYVNKLKTKKANSSYEDYI